MKYCVSRMRNAIFHPRPSFLLDKYERSYYFIFMTKGEDTKSMILDAALDMASRLGLEAVSIGELAKVTGMSKSGLFAHFQSKENLQNEILNHAGRLFSSKVVVPALKTAGGIPRIKALSAQLDWAGRPK